MEKTYNYKAARVQSRIVTALKKSGHESTIADIISSTALPAVQVEEQIREISTRYRGHVKVTESGEMLYFFPNGFHDRTLRRTLNNIGLALLKAARLLFKIWTVVMLVGYAVLFTLLLLAAVFASIAATSSGKGRSRGRGSGILISRIFGLIIRIWFWRSLTSPYRYQSGWNNDWNSKKRVRTEKRPGKPLYQLVFSFLFGDKEEDWQTAEEIELIRVIQRKKGIISVEEVMACTGKTYQEAEQLLHKFCVHYNGEPKASENGSVYYEYRDLLKTSARRETHPSLPDRMPMKKFSENNSNAGVIGVNIFNLAFSSYFLYFTRLAGPAQLKDSFAALYKFVNKYATELLGSSAHSVIALVLGIIPFSYSVLFFLVPALRNASLKKENRKRALRNYRKKLYSYVMDHPRDVQESFLPSPEDSGLADWKKSRQKILTAIGDAADISIREHEGMYSYDYPEIERKKNDIEQLRKALKGEDIGKVIFSSDENI
ncbi:MAG: hypothetical protein JW874_02520 [Spirochaetales bacterium]|nr:hypothetical protein [Spirochaetales bacterium]